MNLQELENEVWKNDVKQKTIDLIQNAESNFTDEDYTSDEIGAYLYEVGICLEVYDTRLRVDIKILKKLETILEGKQQRLKEIEVKVQA